MCSLEKESEEFCPGATDSLSELNSQMVMLMMMSCLLVDGRLLSAKSRIFLLNDEFTFVTMIG